MPTDTRLDLGAELERRVIAKQGTRADIALVLKQRGDVLEACADLIVAAARETKARVELSITVKDGETFDSLVAAGKYDWKYDGITGKRFPVRQSEPGKRKLVLLYFARDISSEDAIAEAAKQGLERPTYEDCLRFGVQHPKVQLGFPVVFLHKPVKILGDAGVLSLGRDDSERRLDYDWVGFDWNDDCRFAFVCPPTAKP